MRALNDHPNFFTREIVEFFGNEGGILLETLVISKTPTPVLNNSTRGRFLNSDRQKTERIAPLLP